MESKSGSGTSVVTVEEARTGLGRARNLTSEEERALRMRNGVSVWGRREAAIRGREQPRACGRAAVDGASAAQSAPSASEFSNWSRPCSSFRRQGEDCASAKKEELGS